MENPIVSTYIYSRSNISAASIIQCQEPRDQPVNDFNHWGARDYHDLLLTVMSRLRSKIDDVYVFKFLSMCPIWILKGIGVGSDKTSQMLLVTTWMKWHGNTSIDLMDTLQIKVDSKWKLRTNVWIW